MNFKQKLINSQKDIIQHEIIAAFKNLRDEIANRKLYVLFESELACDVNTDHINPKNILPLYKRIIDATECYLLKVPFIKSNVLVDDLLQEGFLESDKKIEFYKKQTEQYEKLYHSQHEIEEQLQLVLTEITTDKGKEKQKYMSQIQYLLEQLFNKKQTSDRYKPDFGQESDTQVFNGTISITNSNDKLILEKDEAVRKAVIQQRQLVELNQKQEISMRTITQLEEQLGDYTRMKDTYEDLNFKLEDKVLQYNSIEKELFDSIDQKKQIQQQLEESTSEIKKLGILADGSNKLNNSKAQKEIIELTKIIEQSNENMGIIEEQLDQQKQQTTLFKQKNTALQQKFEELERKSLFLDQQNEQFKLEIVKLNQSTLNQEPVNKTEKKENIQELSTKQKKQNEIKQKLEQMQVEQKQTVLKAALYIKDIESDAFRQITGISAEPADTSNILVEKWNQKQLKDIKISPIDTESDIAKDLQDQENSEQNENTDHLESLENHQLKQQDNQQEGNSSQTPKTSNSSKLKNKITKSKEKQPKQLSAIQIKDSFQHLLGSLPKEVQDQVNELIYQMDENMKKYAEATQLLDQLKSTQKVQNQQFQDQIKDQQAEISSLKQQIQENFNQIQVQSQQLETHNIRNLDNLQNKQLDSKEQQLIIVPTESPTRKQLFSIKDEIEKENLAFQQILTKGKLQDDQIHQIMSKQQNLVNNFNSTLKTLAHQDLSTIDKVEDEIRKYLLQVDKQTQCEGDGCGMLASGSLIGQVGQQFGDKQQFDDSQQKRQEQNSAVDFNSDLPELIKPTKVNKQSNNSILQKNKTDSQGKNRPNTQENTQKVNNTPIVANNLTESDLISTPQTITCPHCDTQISCLDNTIIDVNSLQSISNQGQPNLIKVGRNNSNDNIIDKNALNISTSTDNLKPRKNILFNTRVDDDNVKQSNLLEKPVKHRTVKQVAQLYDSVTVGYDANGKEVFIPKPHQEIEQKLKVVNKILMPLGINPVQNNQQDLLVQLQRKRQELQQMYEKSYMRYNHNEVLQTLRTHQKDMSSMMVVTDIESRKFFSLIGMNLVRTVSGSQNNFRRTNDLLLTKYPKANRANRNPYGFNFTKRDNGANSSFK